MSRFTCANASSHGPSPGTCRKKRRSSSASAWVAILCEGSNASRLTFADDCIERETEILHEVFAVFDPHREAQKRFLDSGSRSCGFIHRRMSHRRGMRNKTFDAAE